MARNSARKKDEDQDNVIVNTGDVKEFAKRICLLEDEKDVLTQDINEIYSEADSKGLDKKALRQAIKAKRKEIELNHKKKVNEYLEALGEPTLFSINGL